MPRNPPAWCSVVMGAVAGVRCFAGLFVGDSWSKNLWCLVQGLQAPKPSTKNRRIRFRRNCRRLAGYLEVCGAVLTTRESCVSGSAPLSRARLGWGTCCLWWIPWPRLVFHRKIVQGLRLALDGPGDCRRWRIEVGTLVPGRCLSLGNSSCWETKGYLMKARPYVWLNPKGGMIARAGCPGLSMFPASFVVDRCTECRVGDMGCWVVASQQQQQQQRQQQHPQYCQNEPSRCDIGQERKVQGLCVGWKFRKTFASAVHVF